MWRVIQIRSDDVSRPILFEGEKNLAGFPMPCRESHDEIGRVSRTRTRYSGESLPVLVGCVMQPAERSLEKETELEEDVDANYGREDVV